MQPIKYINNRPEAIEIVSGITNRWVGLDLETYSLGGSALDPYQSQVRLLQLADDKGAYVLDMPYVGMFDELKNLLLSKDITKVAHNGKFEYKQLFTQYGISVENMFCTMLASQIATAGKYTTHNLKDVSARIIGLQLDKTDQSYDWSQVLEWHHIEYAALDAIACYYLAGPLADMLKAEGLVHVAQLEMQLLPGVAHMELNGLYYSEYELKQLGSTLKEEYGTALKHAQSLLPTVPLPKSFFTSKGAPTKSARENGWLDGRRPPQTRDDFIDAFKQIGVEIPMAKDKTTKVEKESLSKETYGKIKHPAGKILEKWRRTKHLYDAFISPAIPGYKTSNGWYNPVTKLIHPTINQCKTVTGRFSMSDPNFQQQPRRDGRFRKILYAPDGWAIVKADYSQIEMRIMAQVSKDANLIDAYNRGRDVHIMTASQIYGKTEQSYTDAMVDGNLPKALKEERQLGKNVNFGSLYMQGAGGLQDFIYKETGIEYSQKDCEAFLHAFFKTFPGIKQFHEYTSRYVLQEAVRNRYVENVRYGDNWVPKERYPFVGQTLFGRKRFWLDTKVSNRTDRYTGEQYQTVWASEMVNHPIQGTVGDVMKMVMVDMHYNHCNENQKMLLQVHDELVFMVRLEVLDTFCDTLKSTMVNHMKRLVTLVPIEVDVTIGKNWAGEKLAA